MHLKFSVSRAWPNYLRLALLTSLLLLQGVTCALAVDAPISITSKAVVEKQVATEEGRLVIKRFPAAEVLPGGKVIFVNTIINNSDAPAEKVAVSNPIPEHMLFIGDSATSEASTVTFSVNGGASFDLPDKLTVLGDDGKPRPASPADYTDIRWQLSNPLPAKATVQVEFQAQVK